MADDNTCHLCQRDSELRESHIIPRSIIKMVRDKSLNNRFYELKDGQDRIIQDGPKEYLLCDGCEQKIAFYEQYFKEAVHFSRHGTEKKHDGKRLLIENLDYRKMKLFFLSILWRMSISSRPEFNVVSVKKDEERIRRMILKEEPGDSAEYPVGAIVPLINGRNQEGWSTTAFVLKSDAETIYTIMIGGILYFISTVRRGTCMPSARLLNESGCWVMEIHDVGNIPFLQEYIEQHFKKWATE